MKKQEFEAALKALLAGAREAKENTGCIACERCTSSVDCTFCEGSERLVRSHYCKASADLIDCSHCTRCKDCLRSNQCIDSVKCIGSAFLVRCESCVDCTHCFGCVGLRGKEFHVLNQRYDKGAYFALTAQLRKELGLP